MIKRSLQIILVIPRSFFFRSYEFLLISIKENPSSFKEMIYKSYLNLLIYDLIEIIDWLFESRNGLPRTNWGDVLEILIRSCVDNNDNRE